VAVVIPAKNNSCTTITGITISGQSATFEKCKALTANVDNIFLLGTQSHISKYLSIADCFVSASHAEGLPKAVLEALACGLPVLLSDVASHREILSPSPDAGGLFPLGGPNLLSRALQEFEVTVGRREAAQALANNDFSAEAMSHSYQAIYCRHLANVVSEN
jgi:glycosyltransferase involved in cell wall biosynthesis